MIRGVHRVGVHTTNLDRLRSFYEQAFGFEQVGDQMDLGDIPAAALVVGVPEVRARNVMMRAGNCFIELVQWSVPEGRPLEPLRPQDFGYTHFCGGITDIDAEYERLSALGMTFVHPSAVRFEISEIPQEEVLHRESRV